MTTTVAHHTHSVQFSHDPIEDNTGFVDMSDIVIGFVTHHGYQADAVTV